MHLQQAKHGTLEAFLVCSQNAEQVLKTEIETT